MGVFEQVLLFNGLNIDSMKIQNSFKPSKRSQEFENKLFSVGINPNKCSHNIVNDKKLQLSACVCLQDVLKTFTPKHKYVPQWYVFNDLYLRNTKSSNALLKRKLAKKGVTLCHIEPRVDYKLLDSPFVSISPTLNTQYCLSEQYKDRQQHELSPIPNFVANDIPSKRNAKSECRGNCEMPCPSTFTKCKTIHKRRLRKFKDTSGQARANPEVQQDLQNTNHLPERTTRNINTFLYNLKEISCNVLSHGNQYSNKSGRIDGGVNHKPVNINLINHDEIQNVINGSPPECEYSNTPSKSKDTHRLWNAPFLNTPGQGLPTNEAAILNENTSPLSNLVTLDDIENVIKSPVQSNALTICSPSTYKYVYDDIQQIESCDSSRNKPKHREVVSKEINETQRNSNMIHDNYLNRVVNSTPSCIDQSNYLLEDKSNPLMFTPQTTPQWETLIHTQVQQILAGQQLTVHRKECVPVKEHTLLGVDSVEPSVNKLDSKQVETSSQPISSKIQIVTHPSANRYIIVSLPKRNCGTQTMSVATRTIDGLSERKKPQRCQGNEISIVCNQAYYQHGISDTKETKMFQFLCDSCDSHFEDKNELLKHKKCHEELGRCEMRKAQANAQCPFCFRHFGSLKKLRKHLKRYKHDSSFSDEDIDRDTRTSLMYSKNQGSVTRFRAYICKYCCNAYTSEHRLLTHRSKRHKEDNTVKCHNCRSQFKSKYQLIKHFKRGKCTSIINVKSICY